MLTMGITGQGTEMPAVDLDGKQMQNIDLGQLIIKGRRLCQHPLLDLLLLMR